MRYEVDLSDPPENRWDAVIDKKRKGAKALMEEGRRDLEEQSGAWKAGLPLLAKLIDAAHRIFGAGYETLGGSFPTAELIVTSNSDRHMRHKAQSQLSQ